MDDFDSIFSDVLDGTVTHGQPIVAATDSDTSADAAPGKSYHAQFQSLNIEALRLVPRPLLVQAVTSIAFSLINYRLDISFTF